MSQSANTYLYSPFLCFREQVSLLVMRVFVECLNIRIIIKNDMEEIVLL